MQERLQKLTKVIDNSDKVELVMINNALVAATKKQQEEPTAANVKEWRSLKKDLEALVAQLEEKYDMAEQQSSVFKSKIAVFRWLEENGWQISKTQFYDHCKDGLLRPVRSGENKGKYALSAVEKYAKLNVRQASSGKKVNDELDAMQREIAETKLSREKVRLEKEERELEISKGSYVLSADFELALVGRAVVFMSHLNHSYQMSASELIALVDGNQKRAPELVEFLSQLASKRIGEYVADADKEFEVQLEAKR